KKKTRRSSCLWLAVSCQLLVTKLRLGTRFSKLCFESGPEAPRREFPSGAWELEDNESNERLGWNGGKHIMQRFAYCLLPLAALVLSSCSSGSYDFCVLGYTTKSQFDCTIHTVRVPIFRNRTFVRQIEFELTEAVVRQIEVRTPWKVVGGSDDADTELVGTVVLVNKHNNLVNPLNEVRQGDETVGVQILLRDLRTGELLTRLPLPPPIEELPLPGGQKQATPTPVPLQESFGILVLRSASYVPELGQSTSSARKQVVDDLAKQIVNMMEMPW